MNQTGSLSAVIGSLTKTEKRYFRMFARTNREDSNLLSLFDAIDRRKLKGDQELKLHFSGKPFSKHIDVLKVHLQSLILKSMRLYHAERTQNKMIKNMIADIQFYFAKAIYPECEKLIKKAKKMIASSGDLHLMFEVLDLERELHTVGGYGVNMDELNEQIFSEEAGVLKKIEDEINIKYMCDKAVATNKRYGLSRNEKEYQVLQEMIAHVWLDEKNAHTFRSRRLIYFAKSVIHFTSNEYELAEEITRKIISLHEENIGKLREKPLAYLSAITNCAIANIRMKRHDAALELIEKMRHLPALLISSAKHSKDLIQRIETTSYMFEFAIYIERGNLKGAEKVLPDYLKIFEKYKHIMPLYRQVEIKFSFLTYYFMHGDYAEALEILTELETMRLDKHKHDIFSMMRILKLVIHFELNNRNLLPYFVKSTYHALLKDKRLFRFEQLFLEFLRKDVPRTTTKRQLIESFKKLKIKLEEIESDPYEGSAFVSFDITSWLNSKINHSRFIEEVALRSKLPEKI